MASDKKASALSEKARLLRGGLSKTSTTTRIVYLVMGVFFVGLVISTLTKNHDAVTKSPTAGSAEVVSLSGGSGHLGQDASQSPEYQKLMAQAQKDAASQAASSASGSFVPVPIAAVGAETYLDRLERERQEKMKAQAAKNRELAMASVTQSDEDLARAAALRNMPSGQKVKEGRAQGSDQETYGAEDAFFISSLVKNMMRAQTSGTIEHAAEMPIQGVGDMSAGNQGYPVGSNGSADPQGGQGFSPATMSQGAAQSPQGSNNQGQARRPDFQAGSLFYAILKTRIKNTEPSPIFADILSSEDQGGMAGARLIGSVTFAGEAAVLQFTVASKVPGQSRSVPINAVAYNLDTEGTAMADDVDHQYLQRFPMLFASAFLGGYADAISRQNTTQTVTSTGNVVVAQGALSTADINRMALARVGQAGGTTISDQAGKLGTIISVNPGKMIGIYLLSDLTLPNPPTQNQGTVMR